MERLYKQTTLLILTSIFSLWSISTGAGTKRQRYSLDVHEHKTAEYESTFTLRLYDTVTRHTIWKRTVVGYGPAGGGVVWSKDSRAIAIPVQFSYRHEAILFWRAGHKAWECPRNAIIKRDYDYELNEFVWSADKNKVLFRTGGSGSGDANIGNLWCADIQRRRLYFLSEAPIRKVEWVNAHAVRYWTAHFDQTLGDFVVSPRSKTLHCP